MPLSHYAGLDRTSSRLFPLLGDRNEFLRTASSKNKFISTSLWQE